MSFSNSSSQSANLLYEKPITNSTVNKSSYTPSVVSQLQAELDSTRTELYSTRNELQQQRASMEDQRRQMEEQQRQLEEQKLRMEAQCKLMEEQNQVLLGMQSQMALMSSLLGHPSELHESEK